jgi:hypothetical protein
LIDAAGGVVALFVDHGCIQHDDLPGAGVSTQAAALAGVNIDSDHCHGRSSVCDPVKPQHAGSIACLLYFITATKTSFQLPASRKRQESGRKAAKMRKDDILFFDNKENISI